MAYPSSRGTRSRQAWPNDDAQYNHFPQQRNTEDRQGRDVREPRTNADSHSVTTEQDMDVDSSEQIHRDTMKIKNTEELFLKLEGLPTLIQNSKQELRALKQLLSTRNSNETLKLKEEIERLTMKNQALQARYQDRSSHEENMTKMERELQVTKEENEKYKSILNEVFPKYKEANTQIKALQESVDENKHRMEKMTNECETLKERLATLQNSYQQVNDEKTKVEKELSESKTRLSRLMGNKLGDNNPDIADLSDKNRPTKLAEKNTELYDNEWTDAFEVFQTRYQSEEKTIEKLLEILQDIKAECDKIAKDQEGKLKEAMKLKPSSRDALPDHVFKQLKDFRRFTAEESLPEVIKKCNDACRFKDYGRFLRDEGVSNFFKGCVELCWFMKAQDPPLAFGDTPRKNGQFDSNKFKFYTATGSTYDYMVWPALLLTKGGAILSKGVAQASKEQNRGSDRSHRNETRSNADGSHHNVGTHFNHYNNASNANYETTNYEQLVVGGSDRVSNKDKRGFSRTVKEQGSATVASKLGKDFGSSHRECRSDRLRKQELRPITPDSRIWSTFVRLNAQYDVNSEEMKTLMGANYNVCKDHYLYHYGNNSNESNV